MTENVNKFRAALSHPKKKASIFAIATIRLGGLTDIIQSFKNGEMKFVNKQLLTDEQWKELNEKLWERDFVRFVEHDGKMRLTQVSSPEIMRKAEESRRTRPNATLEEMVDATHRAIQRDNYYHDQEMIMMKKALERR